VAEGIPEKDIRGLFADARQGDQFLHRVRDLFAEALGHALPQATRCFALFLKKPVEPNELSEFRKMSRSQLCRLPIPQKERWSDLVDSLVGALGGEDCGHEQFPRGTMLEFHLRAWHGALERLRNLSETLPIIR
jgi:hypothetical protein